MQRVEDVAVMIILELPSSTGSSTPISSDDNGARDEEGENAPVEHVLCRLYAAVVIIAERVLVAAIQSGTCCERFGVGKWMMRKMLLCVLE